MSANELSAPLSAAGGSPNAKYLIKGSEVSNSANDSLIASDGAVRRITANRAAAIAARLSDRDLVALDMLNRTHIASGQQLRRLIWGSGPSEARQSRRQLARLAQLRVLARLTRSVAGQRSSEGFLYRLDVAGQFICGGQDGRRRRPWTPGLAFIDHALAVTECFIKLKEIDRLGEMKLLDFKAEPACWHQFTGIGGQTVILKPDALAVVGIDEFVDHWWLEIDRSTENPARVQRKAMVYVDLWNRRTLESVFPRVLWVVPDRSRQQQLVRALAELDADYWQLFQICTVDRFCAVIKAGAGEINNATRKEGD